MTDAPLTIPDDGPHRGIATSNLRDRFALDLFDVLWDRYRGRVSYVRDYERVILESNATFVNDHIAFRTLAGQDPLTGIAVLSRIFEALGYRPGGCYSFEDKRLNAIHYRHPHPEFPKLFVSELKTWELPEDVCATICGLLASHRRPIAVDRLRRLANVEQCNDEQRSELLAAVVAEFHDLPWDLPEKADVEAVNADSQYAAWVMVHGYNVNHFTSLVNSH
ncbi:MAG: 2-oxoadipate dioxygenase/decarboxylase family protein, partial [Planctomycetaceae bacterium]